MDKAKHTRFYIDLPKEENALLKSLAAKLTSELGVKVTKLQAIRLAVRTTAVRHGL